MHQTIQLLYYTVVIAAIIISNTKQNQSTIILSIGICGLVLILLQLECSEIKLLWYLRTPFADISSTSAILACISLHKNSTNCDCTISDAEQQFILAIGCFLYASSLGFTYNIYLYHYGYINSNTIIWFILLIWLLIINNFKLGYVWLIALIGYTLDLQNSTNLWDYLIDFPLFCCLSYIFSRNFVKYLYQQYKK